MMGWALNMDNQKKQRSFSSVDADEVGAAKSQLRKKVDLGSSTPTTRPSVLRPTTPIHGRRTSQAVIVDAVLADERQNARPTIPTPARPRVALSCIPRRMVTDTELMALPLDHRAAFVLMNVDGRTSIRSLIDVTGMDAEELVAMIERLHDMSAISLV
jgi:hypothetical protein